MAACNRYNDKRLQCVIELDGSNGYCGLMQCVVQPFILFIESIKFNSVCCNLDDDDKSFDCSYQWQCRDCSTTIGRKIGIEIFLKKKKINEILNTFHTRTLNCDMIKEFFYSF